MDSVLNKTTTERAALRTHMATYMASTPGTYITYRRPPSNRGGTPKVRNTHGDMYACEARSGSKRRRRPRS